MKTTIRFKLLMGAASVLLGGAIFALAASGASVPGQGTNYQLNLVFTNASLGKISNAPLPSLVFPQAFPQAAFASGGEAFADQSEGVVATDGSGKIDGVQRIYLISSGVKNDYVGDISGSVTTIGKSNTPVVRMTIKATGYVTNATGPDDTSTLNVTFTSSGGIVSNAPGAINLTTNGVDYVINPDGTTNFSDPRTRYWYPGETSSSASSSSNSAYSTLGYMYNVVKTNALGGFTYQNTNTYVPVIGVTNLVTVETDFGISNHINFGTATDPTPIYTVQAGQNPALFNVLAIGTNMVVSFGVTNYTEIYGITNVADFISALNYTNPGTVVNNAGMSIDNGGLWQFSTALSTNTTAASSSANTNFTRSYSDTWFSLNGTLKGTLKNGTSSAQTFNEPVSLAESHTEYTQFAGTNGQVNVLIKPVYASVDVHQVDSLDGRVVQSSLKVFSLISTTDSGFNFIGNGNVTTAIKQLPKHVKSTNVTYTASISGRAQSRGSSLSLKGTAGTYFNPFGINTNAPAATLTLSNNLVSPPAMTATISNIVSGILISEPIVFASATFDTTNLVVFLTDFGRQTVTNTVYVTNLVNNAILTVTATGNVSGQKLPTLQGYNQGATYNAGQNVIDTTD
jgi:hypothetical protein